MTAPKNVNKLKMVTLLGSLQQLFSTVVMSNLNQTLPPSVSFEQLTSYSLILSLVPDLFFIDGLANAPTVGSMETASG